jgi:hypothetical protein
MSSWTDMEMAEYDAWLDEHDLTFQMNYQAVDSFIELLDIALQELDGNVNEEYLWQLWEQRHSIAA